MKIALLVLLLMVSIGTAQTQYPVTIRHDMGETVVPHKPTRVVVIAEEMAEILHVLGVKPVGYASRRPTGAAVGAVVGEVNSSIAATLRGSTWLGLVEQPSLEVIMALRPDLIVAFNYRGFVRGEGYGQLSRIAPTLVFSFVVEREIGWDEPLLQVARALDLEARAHAYLRQYNQKLATLRVQFAPIQRRYPRFNMLFLPNEQVRFIMGPRHPFAAVMIRLGFRQSLPPGLNIPAAATGAMISPELLSSLPSDLVIALRLQNPDGSIPAVSAEALVERGRARYLRYPLPPLEPSSGPITDLTRAQTILSLLQR